jgi:hypothetical protein
MIGVLEEMTMIRVLAASVAGGAVLFFWGFLTHVVIDWYAPAWRGFSDEAAMIEAIEAHAPAGGLYYLPFRPDPNRLPGTEAMVVVRAAGERPAMAMQMATGFAINVVSVGLVLLLLAPGAGASFGRRIGHFALAGLVIGFVGHAYYWNWFGFPGVYFGLSVADAMIAWTLAGLVAVPLARQRRSRGLR